VAVGGYLLYNYLSTPVAAAATTTTTATPTATPVSTTVTTGGAVTPPTPVTPVEPPPQQPGTSLASIYSNVLAGASTDPNFTGAGDSLNSSGYRWNVYLGLALPSADAIPNVPGFDLSQDMTATQYWAVMAPALTKAYGLSGFFAGLGAYAASMRGMGDVASDFAAASGGVDMNSWPSASDIAAALNDGNAVPVLQDSMTVTPSTAGKGYNVNPTTGALTPAGMSTTTILMLAAAGIFGFALLMGRK
jgi:hypothetical protein